MPLTEFKKSIFELKTALSLAKSRGIELAGSSTGKVYDYSKSKEDYYRKSVQTALEIVKKKAASLAVLGSDPENGALITRISSLVNELESSQDKDSLIKNIIGLASGIDVPQAEKLKKPDFLPREIREDITADINEMSRTFNAGCYRSTAILCGRVLEVALHMKYFQETGIDLLEKSPGIGLGKIVAKLSEKNIEFDPGLMQQIHLINNVRISSVHIKQESFNPTKAQAQAMMMYTMDILEKIFKK